MATGTAGSEDGGIEHGALLRRYAKAILEDAPDLVPAREAVADALSVDAAIQAASIVASFDGINRVADATGIRLDEESERRGSSEIIRQLEFEELGAARGT